MLLWTRQPSFAVELRWPKWGRLTAYVETMLAWSCLTENTHPLCPPKDAFLVPKLNFIANILRVLIMVLADAPCLRSKRSEVRILSGVPLKSLSLQYETFWFSCRDRFQVPSRRGRSGLGLRATPNAAAPSAQACEIVRGTIAVPPGQRQHLPADSPIARQSNPAGSRTRSLPLRLLYSVRPKAHGEANRDARHIRIPSWMTNSCGYCAIRRKN